MSKMTGRGVADLGLLILMLSLLPAACGGQSSPQPAAPTRAAPTHQPAPSSLPTVYSVPTQTGAVSPLPTAGGSVSPLPTPGDAASPLATPATTLPADPVAALAAILAAPDRYIGQKVTVAGTLVSEGNMPDVRFYLTGPGSQRLEVTPWLPIEVMLPVQGGKAPDIMANFVGRLMLITGALNRGERNPILVVLEGAPR